MKRLWRWILSLFKRMPAEEKIARDLNEERWKSPRAFRNIVKFFRGQWGKGGPNMPKRQTCPQCTAWTPRGKKTVAGAYYDCRPCGFSFFVVNSAVARVFPDKIAAGAL